MTDRLNNNRSSRDTALDIFTLWRVGGLEAAQRCFKAPPSHCPVSTRGGLCSLKDIHVSRDTWLTLIQPPLTLRSIQSVNRLSDKWSLEAASRLYALELVLGSTMEGPAHAREPTLKEALPLLSSPYRGALLSVLASLALGLSTSWYISEPSEGFL